MTPDRAVPEQAKAVRPAHQFQPGKSGNPAGRKPKPPEVRQLEVITKGTLERHLEALLGTAVSVVIRSMHQKDDPQLAARCAMDVLDRVGGKAMQRIAAEINVTDEVRRPDLVQLRHAAMQLLARDADDAVVPTGTVSQLTPELVRRPS